ncbi:MAG: hypothetical protein JSU63_17620 [Phycisphaerales bacterium]|nr:MAG: hypothetical protein JSU63_17620 [Phycisphaerales bacterium]
MITTIPAYSRSESGNADAYRRVFRRQVHELLKLGYDRLTPADCCAEQEETITGFLVEAIDGVLDCPSEDWMRFLSVHEDPRVHDQARKGKRRRRVDLRVDSSVSRARTRFSFEAKRLGKDHPVGEYLGQDGMGCFLSGAYARDDDQAGMLGYVQAGTPQQWVGRIRSALETDPSRYNMPELERFSSVEIVDGLNHTYRSNHDRPSVGRRVSIFHTLLQFN